MISKIMTRIDVLVHAAKLTYMYLQTGRKSHRDLQLRMMPQRKLQHFSCIPTEVSTERKVSRNQQILTNITLRAHQAPLGTSALRLRREDLDRENQAELPCNEANGRMTVNTEKSGS